MLPGDQSLTMNMCAKKKISEDDTIAAVATGAGGSISIIRISGINALETAARIWQTRSSFSRQNARKLLAGKIIGGKGVVEDECLGVYMPNPDSYTGEDVIEFQCHGGVMVAQTVLNLLLANGARSAEPGEFTKRAFINGKIDLTQAEAVHDIIQSQSEMALHAATRQLDGTLGRKINSIYSSLRNLLGEIEVRMDFCDENLDWSPPDVLEKELESAAREVETLKNQREEGEILRNGINVAIVGAPNAGKSSLLNMILGRNRAIVTDLPGTTRDTLEELANVRGIPIRFIDTAGIRESNDRIEMEGVARSKLSIQSASLILWVIDLSQPFEGQKIAQPLLNNKNLLAVANKIDICTEITFASKIEAPLIRISALTGLGLDELYDAIEAIIWKCPRTIEPEFAINSRHNALLDASLGFLKRATQSICTVEYELVAVDIRAAIDALGKITGRTVQADVLENIFHKFCIGK